MTIEDLIILLATRGQMNPYDSKMVWSLYDQILRGIGFTEKQATLAIKILHRQSNKLSLMISQDIEPFLENPVFKLSKRTINSAKRISVIADAEYGKAIKVEFPYNENILEKIRKEKINFTHAAWNPDEKAWIFALSERVIQFLKSFVTDDNFSPDEEFADYIEQITEIQEKLENFIPAVVYHEKTVKFVNVSNRLPQPTTTNVLDALFLARKSGIHTWDDGVDQYLTDNNIEKTVIDFLNENPGSNFTVNLEENSIFSISDVIKNLMPCLFIIPGGIEMEKLETSINFLKSLNVTSEEMSVMFRLPKETGEKFNIFVRDEKLNNPITEKTRVVFISSKLPKTVIESKIKFNCVVNFSLHSVHYTIRDFVKNHHNVIHILDKKPQRSLNFAFL
jgi:hypothetical protein